MPHEFAEPPLLRRAVPISGLRQRHPFTQVQLSMHPGFRTALTPPSPAGEQERGFFTVTLSQMIVRASSERDVSNTILLYRGGAPEASRVPRLPSHPLSLAYSTWRDASIRPVIHPGSLRKRCGSGLRAPLSPAGEQERGLCMAILGLPAPHWPEAGGYTCY